MKKILYSILISGLFLSFFIATPAYADVCGSISECNQKIQDTQKAANANQSQINSIQDMVNGLNAQTAATQTEMSLIDQQINLTGKQINDTQSQIEQKQKDMDQKKVDLNKTIVAFYETGTPSMTEIIARADNVSGIIDISQDFGNIGDQMTAQADQMAKDKISLETAKTDLEKQKSDLNNQQASLLDKRRNLDIQNAQKNRLLSQANATQSQLQATLSQAQKDKNTIAASLSYRGGDTKNLGSGGGGGYPFANDTPDTPDPWGFYKRECTSYAAWWFNAHGKAWYNTEPGLGSAWNWPALAVDQGYSVSPTPREGAIVSWSSNVFSPYGHVAIVQKVYSDGSYDVSQYNWVQYSYSEMHVSGGLASAGRFIY